MGMEKVGYAQGLRRNIGHDPNHHDVRRLRRLR
jgi:hypothetical protein